MTNENNLPIARICKVKTLNGFNVQLSFSDGVEKVVNLEKYLHGPAFEEIRRDPKIFQRSYVDRVNETIMWHNGADIDADVLRYDLVPAWMEKQTSSQR